MNILVVIAILISFSPFVVCIPINGNILVRNRGVFKVDVSIAGSEADREILLFDTGSPFTWIYHYRFVRDILRLPQGGYGTTKLRTKITPPEGGEVIKYADESVYEATVWTLRSFTMGNQTWIQPFGIVSKSGQTERVMETTGLLGASRSSAFVKLFPLFGFRPVSRGLLSLSLSGQDHSAVCHEGRMVYFDLVKAGQYAAHWATDTVVQFNKVVILNTGVIFDTGASVLGLNSVAFVAFTHQLDLLGIPYTYKTNFALAGDIDCANVKHLPSWEIHHQNSIIVITPQMYVVKRSASSCGIKVGHLSGDHPIVLGTPLLGNVVSEFDADNSRVGICRPIASFITDYDHAPGMNDYNEVHDCPSCDPGNGIQTTGLSWLLSAIIFVLYVDFLMFLVCCPCMLARYSTKLAYMSYGSDYKLFDFTVESLVVNQRLIRRINRLQDTSARSRYKCRIV